MVTLALREEAMAVRGLVGFDDEGDLDGVFGGGDDGVFKGGVLD